MKKLFIALALLISGHSFSQVTYPTFHSYNAITILGDTISLSQYAGKKLLVVNTASFCGFTPQYADLEQLYTLYGGPNFEILGFPCDDFGHQEPGNDSAINVFCTGNYNVTFQMMSKVFIAVPDTEEVYKWLQRQDLNGVANAQVTWNFNKFLIDEAGHWIAHYTQGVNPMDTAIVNWILSPNTTGLVKNNEQDLISLNGNPVKDNLVFNVNTDYLHLMIDLFSIDGRFIDNIYSGDVKSGLTISRPVAKIPGGFYLLKASTPEYSRTFKICIVK